MGYMLNEYTVDLKAMLLCIGCDLNPLTRMSLGVAVFWPASLRIILTTSLLPSLFLWDISSLASSMTSVFTHLVILAFE